MNIKSLIGTRILVQEVKPEEVKTEGGLILAQLDNANQPRKGKVIKAGVEIKDYIERYKGKPLNEGAEILYDNTQYQTLMDGTTSFDIIDLSNLIAVL